MDRPSEIGSTIVIKGEVTAREDLVVSGRVEGRLTVTGHSLTIRAGAEVVADLEAQAVVVSGRVRGDVNAGGRIILHGGSNVEGTLATQHLGIEDGALFAGKAATTGTPARSGLQLAS